MLIAEAVPATQVRAVAGRLGFADALRAVAIMLVVSSHLPTAVPHLVGADWPTWGVNCFFILSGFLLARPYLEALLDPAKRFPSTRLFLLRRFLRIYPLYVVSVMASSALLPLEARPLPSAWDVVAHLFMLEDFSPATVYSINAPLWTMPVDAAFYLALPIGAFALLAPFRRMPSRFRASAIAAVLVAVAAGGIAWRAAAVHLEPGILHDVATRYVFIHNAIGMAPSFAIGIGLALLALQTDRTAVARTTVVAALTLAVVLDAVVRYSDIVGSDAPDVVLASRIVWGDLIAACSVACVVFTLQRTPAGEAPVFRTRFVASLAGLAYAVYLFHYPVLEIVMRRFGLRSGYAVAAEEIALGLLCTLAVAYVAHRYVEQPFLDLKDRLR